MESKTAQAPDVGLSRAGALTILRAVISDKPLNRGSVIAAATVEIEKLKQQIVNLEWWIAYERDQIKERRKARGNCHNRMERKE